MAEIVAELNDARLYPHDVALLQPRQWLNDQLIAFAFEELGARFSGEAVVLLEPATVYMALMLQDSATMREMLSVGGTPSLAERLAKAKLVLMPINDKDDPEAHSGGSHWSLLAFRVVASTGERRFEHYDSCAQSNRGKAEAVAKCLAPLLCESGVRGCGFAGMEDTPQQANGHDCGLYTIAIAEALCEGLASDQLPAALGAIPARVAALTPARVDEKRAALKQLVAACAPKSGG